MKLITFGLGGPSAGFLRMGFGASAKAAQRVVDGGVLRGQFRPVVISRPLVLELAMVSRVAVRIRIRSQSVLVVAVSRVRYLAPARIGAGGYVRGGRGERAFHELQRTAKDLNCIAAMVEHLRKRHDDGNRMMTKSDRQLLCDTIAYLQTIAAGYQVLANALAEPRYLTVEANAYEVLARSAREQADNRALRDLRDVRAVELAVAATDRAQRESKG